MRFLLLLIVLASFGCQKSDSEAELNLINDDFFEIKKVGIADSVFSKSIMHPAELTYIYDSIGNIEFWTEKQPTKKLILSKFELLSNIIPYFGRVLIAQKTDSLSENQKDVQLTDATLLFIKLLNRDSVNTQFGYSIYNKNHKQNTSKITFEQFISKPDSILNQLLPNRMNTYLEALNRFAEKQNLPDSLSITDSSHWNLLLSRLGYSDSLNKNIAEFQKDYELNTTASLDSVTWQTLKNANSISKEQILLNVIKNIEINSLVKSSYIQINIAANRLNYYQNDASVLEMKTITGLYNHHTPTIVSTITSVVSFPYWNVPKSIVIDEFVNEFISDPNFGNRNHFELIDSEGKSLDVYAINWKRVNTKNFNYTLRQKTGCDNSLGVLKFYFESPYDIYLHDTDAKYLFDRANRHESHGCIRLEKPLELAEMLLPNSKELDKKAMLLCLKNQETKWLKTMKRDPLIIAYHTLSVSEKGHLIVYKDIYRKEKTEIKQISAKWFE